MIRPDRDGLELNLRWSCHPCCGIHAPAVCPIRIHFDATGRSHMQPFRQRPGHVLFGDGCARRDGPEPHIYRRLGQPCCPLLAPAFGKPFVVQHTCVVEACSDNRLGVRLAAATNCCLDPRVSCALPGPRSAHGSLAVWMADLGRHRKALLDLDE